SYPKVQIWDRSPLALEFSRELLQRDISIIESDKPPQEPFTLILSHVLTELSEEDQVRLLHFVSAAEEILWVEPGIPFCSHRLVEIREELLTQFHPVAPCPHEKTCGLLALPKEWCHHYAHVPSFVFQSAFWRKFSGTLGIDLRSLPLVY